MEAVVEEEATEEVVEEEFQEELSAPALEDLSVEDHLLPQSVVENLPVDQFFVACQVKSFD